jgi:type IV secretory pathway VirB9-like protein
MRSTVLHALFVGFAVLLAATALRASTPPKRLEPSGPRTVLVSEAGAPPVVRTGVLESTLLVLPAEEKVVSVFAGDTVDWVFDAGHVPGRFVSIKPKLANAATDVHIISDHGNEYTLEVLEVSGGDDDPHFDSKLFLLPADGEAKTRLAELPLYVPATELEEVKKESAAALAAKTAAAKASQDEQESVRSKYPATLAFDYTWNKSQGKKLGLDQIWRDERFTYLRGQFQETPALYEVKDKKPSLINFDFSNGLYTIPKLIEEGYLSIGKQKVSFHRAQTGRQR